MVADATDCGTDGAEQSGRRLTDHARAEALARAEVHRRLVDRAEQMADLAAVRRRGRNLETDPAHLPHRAADRIGAGPDDDWRA